jgi:hypothetical protein
LPSNNNFIPHPKKSPTDQSDRPCSLFPYAHNFFTRLIYFIPGSDPETEGRASSRKYKKKIADN